MRSLNLGQLWMGDDSNFQITFSASSLCLLDDPLCVRLMNHTHTNASNWSILPHKHICRVCVCVRGNGYITRNHPLPLRVWKIVNSSSPRKLSFFPLLATTTTNGSTSATVLVWRFSDRKLCYKKENFLERKDDPALSPRLRNFTSIFRTRTKVCSHTNTIKPSNVERMSEPAAGSNVRGKLCAGAPPQFSRGKSFNYWSRMKKRRIKKNTKRTKMCSPLREGRNGGRCACKSSF